MMNNNDIEHLQSQKAANSKKTDSRLHPKSYSAFYASSVLAKSKSGRVSNIVGIEQVHF